MDRSLGEDCLAANWVEPAPGLVYSDGALLLLSLFYLLYVPTLGVPQPNSEGTYLIVNKTLIEAIAVIVLLAFDTGRIAGLDLLWRRKRGSSVEQTL